MKTELNRMGRIWFFPLFFQNGCSKSSRFLPQARRIVGSGDENDGGQHNNCHFGTTDIFCKESKTFPEDRRCKEKKLKTSFPRQNVVTPTK